MKQSNFFAKGDAMVNAEIDRVNELRKKSGMTLISKNKNATSNKLIRQSLSIKLQNYGNANC